LSIVVAIALAVVLGAVGLALDGGHLFVTKTELQNAADACALAASQELTGPPGIAPEAFSRAEAAGRALARRHRLGFQTTAVADDQVEVQFGPSLAAGATWLAADEAPGDARFVRCILRREGIAPWFLQVLGVGEQRVRALATATLAPARTNCGIPMAVCARGSANQTPAFGLVNGSWLEGRFGTGGGVTGSFNWIDYTPPAGGASEVGGLLRGAGQCRLDIDAAVGQPGQLGNAGARAWNTRFGLYQGGGDSAQTAPPDFTGHAYTPQSWPAKSSALADFLERRRDNAPYGASVFAGNAASGLTLGNAYDPVTTAAQHREFGADRRLVVVPVVDCGDWAGSQTSTIQSWACVLMLHPVAQVSDAVRMEYLGLAQEPDSPCATSGLPGSVASIGPRVPALVQ
jgi:hypothetical protein